MKRDRITVFNRATESELDDVSAFEHLVGDHYDYFRMMYQILEMDSLIDFVEDVKYHRNKSGYPVFKLTMTEDIDIDIETIIHDNVLYMQAEGYKLYFTYDIIDDRKVKICIDEQN